MNRSPVYCALPVFPNATVDWVEDFRHNPMVRAWNVIENGMKWNGNFGMEYGRCQNGMEWKISRME